MFSQDHSREIASLISQTRQGQSYFYHYHQGLSNVTHLTNSTGSIVQTYTYGAFGSLVSESGSLSNSYRFSTKEFDSRSKLIYFGARYYNPQIGRWLTPDPLGMVNGPNLYVYLGNNPINLIDPWGLCGGPIESKTGRGQVKEDLRRRNRRGSQLVEPPVPEEPEAEEGILQEAESSSLGYGIVEEVLIIGGGIALTATGIYVANPTIIKIGIGLVILGTAMKIHELITLPEREKRIAIRIYKRTGLKGHYKEIEEISKELKEILRR